MVFKYNASMRGIVVTHDYINGVQTHRFKLSKQNKDGHQVNGKMMKNPNNRYACLWVSHPLDFLL